MLTQTNTHILQIPVAMIVPNPKQPRKRFRPEELESLTASIREHGVIQPLIVCPAGGDGIHTLIAGERRLRAAKGASLTTVPAVIRNVNPDDLGVVALIENVIRDDMSPIEEGDAYLELRKKGKSNAQIAKLVGVNDVRLGYCINCASMPDGTREMVHAGTMYKSGDFIATMKSIADIDSESCDELAKEIVRQQPSLKSAEKSAAGVLAYLLGLDKKKDRGRVKSAPVLDVASHLAKIDVDNEEEPQRWNVLQQAGVVPPWALARKYYSGVNWESKKRTFPVRVFDVGYFIKHPMFLLLQGPACGCLPPIFCKYYAYGP